MYSYIYIYMETPLAMPESGLRSAVAKARASAKAGVWASSDRCTKKTERKAGRVTSTIVFY